MNQFYYSYLKILSNFLDHRTIYDHGRQLSYCYYRTIRHASGFVSYYWECTQFNRLSKSDRIWDFIFYSLIIIIMTNKYAENLLCHNSLLISYFPLHGKSENPKGTTKITFPYKRCSFQWVDSIYFDMNPVLHHVISQDYLTANSL